MDSIGAEVGQKMRSAIKAKLMELDCYVDDELPDYIMVMVANRRTKSQMNEDLNLFLSTKTSTFVNWLHIVLKKLKEVTVTNPDIYKKAAKRKVVEVPPDEKNALKLKKEKSNKKVKNESQKFDDDALETKHIFCSKSLTDNLPLSINKLTEKRKVIVTNNSQEEHSAEDIAEDNFDIPLLSEVNESSNEQELQDIEKKIRSVKSRLGILVNSDNEEDSIKEPEKDDPLKQSNEEADSSLAASRQITILENEITESEKDAPSSTTNVLGKNRKVEIEKENLKEDKEEDDKESWVEKKRQHKKITFEAEIEVESTLRRPEHNKPSDMRMPDRSWDRHRDRSSERSLNRSATGKKPSILDRLGKKPGSPQWEKRQNSFKDEGSLRNRLEHRNRSTSRERDKDRSNRISSRFSRNERQTHNLRDRRNRSRSRSRERSPRRKDSRKDNILSRVGVQSKIAVIKKPKLSHKNQSSDEEEEKVVRDVPSSIKVKPRVIPSDVPQPNRNLLLKAVADAQRSVAQTPKVGKEVKADLVYTKTFKEKVSDQSEQTDLVSKRLSQKSKIRTLIQHASHRMRSRRQQSSDEYDSDGEYIPKPLKNAERVVPSYTPSAKTNTETKSDEIDSVSKENGKQQFIITLDGIENLETVFGGNKMPVKLRLEDKKSPSPIIFDTNTKSVDSCTRSNIPDTLPIVHPPLSVKNKERCKYWPGCRQGDKCEFVHPSQNCEVFPHCKFGDKCLFLHPKCKFGSSCTKRDCPYDHNTTKPVNSSKLPVSSPLQHCKFFPNCINLSCPFFHPKPCKYGKYCKNIAECTFSHSVVVNRKSLSWKSK